MNTFETLHVKPEIIMALKEEGICEPTSIQLKTIPLVQQGKDLVGISRTGSGKTASFGIPLLEKMIPGKGVQGLILAPTRELANQISGELKKWSKYLQLNIAVVFGGVGMDPQVKAISQSEIVVGTPGRILDHLGRGTLNLSKLNSFVLDEADKMVEMGFIEDIERIISTAPKNRQVLLFGATISNEIDHLKRKYMHDVVIAEAELHVEKDLLKQYYYEVKFNEKFSLLVHLLKKEDTERAIVFCSKRTTVELVNHNLRNQGIKSEMIHGKMSQNKRLNVIERFNNDKVNILVASAVAARGLDIKGVTHIFNYDLSNDPQEYIHRVGRTARAGESGKAITLLSEQDHDSFRQIFQKYKIGAEEMELEDFPRLKFEIQQRRGNGHHSHFQRGRFHKGTQGNESSGEQRSSNGYRSSGQRSSYGSSAPRRSYGQRSRSMTR